MKLTFKDGAKTKTRIYDSIEVSDSDAQSLREQLGIGLMIENKLLRDSIAAAAECPSQTLRKQIGMKKERNFKEGDKVKIKNCLFSCAYEDEEYVVKEFDDSLYIKLSNDEECYNPDHWTLIESPDEPKEIKKITQYEGDDGKCLLNSDIADKIDELVDALNNHINNHK